MNVLNAIDLCTVNKYGVPGVAQWVRHPALAQVSDLLVHEFEPALDSALAVQNLLGIFCLPLTHLCSL